MKLYHLSFGLITLLVLASCNNDKDPAEEPATKANIIGSVNLYDEGVTQIDNSGMTIQVEGTEISATTDADGDFTLSDVPFGTYSLIYEKSGYGTYKKFGIEHKDTGSSTKIIQNPSLGETSTTQVTLLSTSVIGNDIQVSITTDPPGNNQNARYVRYFLSIDSNVSNENYSYYSPGLVSHNNPHLTTLSQSDLISAGFSTGQTVYVKAYGDSFYSNEYDDSDLGRRIFSNLNTNAAAAVSFVVP
ncbi:carboxypeptidase regulatory-like domain-containing protein [Saccharicrinis aurantiacus]|uniref:carboxypeptidase regulatory-like domain-containing protein n=1 Tax=Saccharicrinis aurantiacus TaxID=1849719 RepID=UPI0024915A69|nr:carboxypeptidase-like regulatory domain-containing protein [Saccharicrinis aurantiacus]